MTTRARLGLLIGAWRDIVVRYKQTAIGIARPGDRYAFNTAGQVIELEGLRESVEEQVEQIRDVCASCAARSGSMPGT